MAMSLPGLTYFCLGSVITSRLFVEPELIVSGAPILVPSLDRDGTIQYKESELKMLGEKDCRMVTFGRNRFYFLAKDQKVLTKDGYKRVDQLTREDHIAHARRYPEPPFIVDVPDEHIKLVAYLLADGCCHANTPTFTNSQRQILQEVKECVAALGMSIGVEHIYPTYTRLSIRGGARFARKWGINKPTAKKSIPLLLLSLPRSKSALFLNRFWACDGSIHTKNRQGNVQVNLASSSLIDDLRFLIMRLGIPVKKIDISPTNRDKIFNAWRLTIANAPGILCFLDEVGPIFGKKEDKSHQLRRIAQETASRSNSKWDMVPVKPQDLDFAGRSRRDEEPKQYYSRQVLQRIAAEHPEFKYNWMADAELYWEQPRVFRDLGMWSMCGFEVADSHNFVSGDLIVRSAGAC